MLRRVEQQAENIRWQLSATDAAILEQLIGRHLSELIEGAIDPRARLVHEIVKRGGWVT